MIIVLTCNIWRNTVDVNQKTVLCGVEFAIIYENSHTSLQAIMCSIVYYSWCML